MVSCESSVRCTRNLNHKQGSQLLKNENKRPSKQYSRSLHTYHTVEKRIPQILSSPVRRSYNWDSKLGDVTRAEDLQRVELHSWTSTAIEVSIFSVAAEGMPPAFIVKLERGMGVQESKSRPLEEDKYDCSAKSRLNNRISYRSPCQAYVSISPSWNRRFTALLKYRGLKIGEQCANRRVRQALKSGLLP